MKVPGFSSKQVDDRFISLFERDADTVPFMRRRSPYQKARRRRAITGLIVILVIATGSIVVLESRFLAGAIAHTALQRAGIPDASLAVQSIGLRGISFDAVQFGTAGPSVRTIDVGWTPWALLHGKLRVLRLQGLKIGVALDHGTVMIEGLPVLRGSAGGTDLPFDSLDISDMTATIKAGAGTAVLSGSLNATRREGRVFGGRATIDGTVTTTSGNVTALKFEIPDWRVTLGDMPIKLDIASASLSVPAEHAALCKIAASLAVDGAAATVVLNGELQDTDGSQHVAGRVGVDSSVDWGGTALASTLKLSLGHVKIANDLAELSDLSGTIALDSVVPAHTAGPQHLTGSLRITTLTPGALDFVFDVPGANHLQIERATVALAGGTVSLDNLGLAPDQPVDVAIAVNGVDLAAVLTLIGIDGLSGTGILDGQIPIHLDAAGVSIANGLLMARGPGTVRYAGSALPGTTTLPAGGATDTVSLLRAALADFHYTGLSLALDRAATGRGTLVVGLKGANPGVLNNYPFALNIRLDTDFDRLTALLSRSYETASELLWKTARKK